MTRNPIQLLLTFWLVLAAPAAQTADLSRLLDEGHLSVATEILPQSAVVPGQKTQLVIEIATDTWFTGGTRITVPEVPGLVILQNEQFASNATESRGGETWVVQRWTLDVFAQREGSHRVPPIRLRVSVNAGNDGNLEGELFTPSTTFETTLPAALESPESWVASPAFTVKQQFNRSLEDLNVGDAFDREITFEASDVMAMMLPVAVNPTLDGLASYPAPPQLENRNNRGDTLARRVETTSFLAEQPGEYTLPAQEFFWWDTESGTLEIIELPAQTVSVGGAAVTVDKASTSKLPSRRTVLAGAALLIVVLLAAALARIVTRLPWDRARAVLIAASNKIAEFRRPALPRRLNPGNSAGD